MLVLMLFKSYPRLFISYAGSLACKIIPYLIDGVIYSGMCFTGLNSVRLCVCVGMGERKLLIEIWRGNKQVTEELSAAASPPHKRRKGLTNLFHSKRKESTKEEMGKTERGVEKSKQVEIVVIKAEQNSGD